MTKEEKRIVMAVFDSLMHQSFTIQTQILGSTTREEMDTLYQKLKHEDFCKRRGIRYEDMTANDFIDAFLEAYGE